MEVQNSGATLVMAVLLGSGPLSDTMKQQHASLPLPSGGRGGGCRALIDTVNQQHGGTLASEVAVVNGTIKEGDPPPPPGGRGSHGTVADAGGESGGGSDEGGA